MNTVNHTDRDHAEFSPSALKYLHTCSGFHGKEGSSDAADMGTRIHEALEVRDPSTLQSEEEVNIYDQLVMDEKEVFDFVFVDTLDNVEIFREKRLHLELDALSPTFGTCDIVAISSLGVALVADYKTGISIRPAERELAGDGIYPWSVPDISSGGHNPFCFSCSAKR